MAKNIEGLVHLYTGDGKGKTTAALGIGVRAAMNSLDVIMIKFLKGQKYAEDDIANYIPNFEIHSYGTGKFVTRKPSKNDKEEIKKAWDHAEKSLHKYDIVILDEVLYAVQMKLVEEKDILDFISKKPKNVELVLTGGWHVNKNIRDAADYVSIIKNKKHPFTKGIGARKGVEY